MQNYVVQPRVLTVGMNRIVFVQTKLNKKRKKRRGKKISLTSKPVLPRVVHILKTGKLKDRTHYREVDPYWGVMWRQYEYLRYMDFYVKKIVSSAIDDGKLDLSNEYDYKVYQSYIKLLEHISKHNKKLVHWMFNAFHIQIGGVLSSRFYGWKEYSDKFIGKFYEIAAELIKKLRFDIDKTRCSVYFYQAFWLGGLSVINEIRQKLYTEKVVTPNPNRGLKLFSLDEFEDFDNMDFISSYIKDFSDYSFSPEYTTDTESAVDDTCNEFTLDNTEENKLTSDDLELVNDKEVTVSTEELDKIESPYTLEDEQEMDEYEVKLKAIEVLRSILEKAGIPIDILYNSENESKQNKIIKLVATRIKRKLKKNEIQLSQQEKQVLSKYLGRHIL